MGVDGFRVDAVPHLYEDQRFLDEPENSNRDPDARPDEYRYWNHLYTYNLPPVLDYLADMRQLLDVYTATDGILRFLFKNWLSHYLYISQHCITFLTFL